MSIATHGALPLIIMMQRLRVVNKLLHHIARRISHHVFHQYTIQLTDVNRDEVSATLTKKGIPNMIYYPVPSHKQDMLKSFVAADFSLPNTDALNDCVLSLPIHTELTEEELKHIADGVLEAITSKEVPA